VRKKKLGSSDTRSQKDIPITEFFNTHRRLHQLRIAGEVVIYQQLREIDLG
jgi:hypothetical protein